MGALMHTVRGSTATYRSAARAPIESLKYYFSPQQDLHGYGKPWIGGGGKNLFDENTIIYGTWTSDTGSISQSEGCRTQDIPVVSGETYTLFYNGEQPYSASIIELDENKNFITRTHMGWQGTQNPRILTITSSSNTKYVYIQVSNYPNTMTLEVLKTFKMQFEVGSSATYYAPYENICPIEGWESITGYRASKNIGHIIAYSSTTQDSPYNTYHGTSNYGTTISTNDFSLPDTSLVITQVAPDQDYTSSGIYRNGYFCVQLDNLIFGNSYDISFKITDIISNPLNKTLNNLMIAIPSGTRRSPTDIIDNIVIFKNITFLQNTNRPKQSDITIYNQGMSFTLSEFMITPAGQNDGVFEPYCGDIFPITFPTTGKNKLNPADIYIYDNHFTLNNGVYTSTVTDTRDYTQLSVQLWKTKGSYLKTLYVDYLKTTGRHVLTFTVDDPKGEYICLKHNGIKKDFILLFPVPLGLRQYTISLDLIANDPTTVGGVQLTNIQLEVGDTATEYEPYQDDVDNTIYGGYVDLVKGEVVAEWVKVKKKISQYTSKTEYDTGLVFYNYNGFSNLPCFANASNTSTISALNSKCSIAQHMWAMNDQVVTHYYIYKVAESNKTRLLLYLLKDSVQSEETEFEIVFRLETPIHYPLISTNQLKSFPNYNNIWSKIQDNIEVTYTFPDLLARKRMEIPRQCRKVLWNQIALPMNGDNWKDYSTTGLTSTTFNDSVATHEYLTDNKGLYSVSICQKTIPTVTANHVYYASYMIYPDHELRCGIEFANNQYATNRFTVPANTWQQCSFVAQCVTTGYGNLYIPNPNPEDISNGYINLIKSPIYIDLTRMFGAGQEPTLSEFEAMCKINHIDLTQYHTQDLTGTEMIWYTDIHDNNRYKTLEWNQLSWAISSGQWELYNSSYASATFENGVVTRTVLQDVSSSWTASLRSKSVLTTDTSHKYYIKQELYSSVAKIYVLTLGGNWCKQISVPADTWTICETIGVPQQSERVYIIYDGPTGHLSHAGDICKLRNPIIVDLTQMFGAGNEPTLQEFRALCTANGVNLDSALPRDTGTKQLWLI